MKKSEEDSFLLERAKRKFPIGEIFFNEEFDSYFMVISHKIHEYYEFERRIACIKIKEYILRSEELKKGSVDWFDFDSSYAQKCIKLSK